MKHFLIGFAAAVALVAIPGFANADSSCTTQISSMYTIEGNAHNEYMSDDYVSAFVHYQQASIMRANCVDETTGAALAWNRVFLVMDVQGMASQIKDGELEEGSTFGSFSYDVTRANDLLTLLESKGYTGDLGKMISLERQIQNLLGG